MMIVTATGTPLPASGSKGPSRSTAARQKNSMRMANALPMSLAWVPVIHLSGNLLSSMSQSQEQVPARLDLHEVPAEPARPPIAASDGVGEVVVRARRGVGVQPLDRPLDD